MRNKIIRTIRSGIYAVSVSATLVSNAVGMKVLAAPNTQPFTQSVILYDTANVSFVDASGEVYIQAGRTNIVIRSSPLISNSTNIGIAANQGDRFTRTGVSTDGTWTRVRLSGGQTAYISTQFLTEANPGAQSSSAQKTAPGASASGTSGNSGNSDSSGSSGAPAASSESSGTAANSSNGAYQEVGLNSNWTYANESKINTGAARLYKSTSSKANGKTVCVNAGHGTSGGERVKTYCHPDHTPKVTGGSTQAGAVTAASVSSGTQMLDGTAEAVVNLQLAMVLKEKLLAAGYNVLMIRESNDVQLDNIARTVIANNTSDCHLALHYDSSTSDKGAYFTSVPNVASYKSMEPVASHWQQHDSLGKNVVQGMREAGVKIFSSGEMGMDLTQTSYSTVPSIDLELGDRASDWSLAKHDVIATGIVQGLNHFFGIS